MSAAARLAKGPWLGLLAAFGLFLLSRPYQGVRHDGRLYVADALAKLDPNGVGKDLMFVHDGQFGFSLYTPLLARLIQLMGLSAATTAIVVLTLVAWFAAAVFMIDRLLSDRPPALRWAALTFVVALPSLYGPMDVIAFGEALATPRGLAEAAGMAGMATYLSGRRFLGLAVCAPGMLFHPIMGLCSVAAIALAICIEDRRWLWAGLAALAAVTAAGLLRLPLADRIATVMDADWRAVVEARSPILFPSLWPTAAWGRLAVHACTVAAGAWLLRGAPRRLALGALIAGLAGVAAAALLGEGLSLVLFVQVQTWRMLQPLALLACACLALLAFELPRRGPSGWLGLCLLAIGWLFQDGGDLGLMLAPVGLLFVLLGEKMRFSRRGLFVAVAVGLLAAAVVAHGALRGAGLAHAMARMPDAWPFSLGLVWKSGLPGVLVALGVGARLVRRWTPPPAWARVAATAAIGLLAILLWDDRPAYVRHRDQGRDPALAAMTSSKAGEVLWLAGDMEPWALLGRASWASKVQGAGVVFSRPLALELGDRIARLRTAGLVGEDWLRPMSAPGTRPAPPRLAAVRAFCAAADAPAWIVWPRWTNAALEPGLAARDWTPKAPYALELMGPGGAGWLTAQRYAVMPCAG